MNTNNKKNIAVLFGGRSVEHEISIITGLQLINNMDVVAYNPIPVYIAPDGKWYTGEILLDKNFYKKLPGSISELSEVTVLPDPEKSGLKILNDPSNKKGWFKKKTDDSFLPVDVFFLAFHGTYGEDGCCQGLLEMADATYTGCNVFSAAISMNKWACKELLRTIGVPSLPAYLLERQKTIKNVTAAIDEMFASDSISDYPLFVKPCNLGSSIGIKPAHNKDSLIEAISTVFKYDTHALIEPMLTEMDEINVSVYDADPPVTSVIEVPVSQTGLLDYDQKYVSNKGAKKVSDSSEGMASMDRKIDPADISDELKNDSRKIAAKVFETLQCSGVARIDFMYDTKNNKLYFNEINTLPGSLAFYLWQKSDPPLVYTDLITKIIERAVEKKGLKTALVRDFGFKALFN